MKGDEGEADGKRVQEHQLQRRGVAPGVEKPLGNERRRRERGDEQPAVDCKQEEEKRAREPLALTLVRAVEPVAHERAVDAPAEEKLHGHFDAREEYEDAVIGRGQVLNVETK